MLQVTVKCVRWQVVTQALALIFTQRGCQHLTPTFFHGQTPFPFSSLPHSPPHSICRPWLSSPSPHSRMALPWSWSCVTLACKSLHTVWPFRTEVMGVTNFQPGSYPSFVWSYSFQSDLACHSDYAFWLIFYEVRLPGKSPGVLAVGPRPLNTANISETPMAGCFLLPALPSAPLC